jgi:hypothetical protein
MCGLGKKTNAIGKMLIKVSKPITYNGLGLLCSTGMFSTVVRLFKCLALFFRPYSTKPLVIGCGLGYFPQLN